MIKTFLILKEDVAVTTQFTAKLSSDLNSKFRKQTCNAQPLATASSRFSVVLISRWNNEVIASFTAGIRVAPPMISTEWILFALNPIEREGDERKLIVTHSTWSVQSLLQRNLYSIKEIFTQILKIFPNNASTTIHTVRLCTDLFILPDTSLSSIKHSMFIGMEVALALINFFSFSHSVISLRVARGWDNTSILYLVLNSAAKCFNSLWSKFLPPNVGSNALDNT